MIKNDNEYKNALVEYYKIRKETNSSCSYLRNIIEDYEDKNWPIGMNNKDFCETLRKLYHRK